MHWNFSPPSQLVSQLIITRVVKLIVTLNFTLSVRKANYFGWCMKSWLEMNSLSWSRSRRGSLFRPVCPPWRRGREKIRFRERWAATFRETENFREKHYKSFPSLRLFVFEARPRRSAALLHVDAAHHQPAGHSLSQLSQVSARAGGGVPASLETIKVGGGGR